MDFIGYIYGLRCACHDAGYRYIGKTERDPRYRIRSHRHNAKNELGSVYNLPVYKWMRKHGIDNIVQDIISTSDSSDELCLLEIAAIEKYGTHVSRTGMNVTLGGDGSRLLPKPEKLQKPDGRKGRKYSEAGRAALRLRNTRGMNSGKASGITDDDVRNIRSRYAAGGVTQKELAKEYGISKSNVSCIVLRQTWTHI